MLSIGAPIASCWIAAMQDYWPAVRKFAAQHTLSESPSEEEAGDEGVQEAVQASQAGVDQASRRSCDLCAPSACCNGKRRGDTCRNVATDKISDSSS